MGYDAPGRVQSHSLLESPDGSVDSWCHCCMARYGEHSQLQVAAAIACSIILATWAVAEVPGVHVWDGCLKMFQPLLFHCYLRLS